MKDANHELVSRFRRTGSEELKAISKRLLESRPAPGTVRVQTDKLGEFPLSFAQERIWFLEQLRPGTPVHNIPARMELRGEIHYEALRGSMDALVARHEILRSRYREQAGRPIQFVDEPGPLAVRYVDLLDSPEDSRAGLLRQVAEADSSTPFDLAKDWPIRVTLARCTFEHHVLLFCLHHIAADGWSVDLLERDLTRLYLARLGMADLPPPLVLNYGQFAAWQRETLTGEHLNQLTESWIMRLAGVPPLMALPLDHSRPRVQTNDGSLWGFGLSAELTASVESVAISLRVTPFMLLLGVFGCLLRKWTGQRDLVIGSPMTCRNQLELEPMIGLFVNTLAIRLKVELSLSFSAMLQQAKEKVLEAQASQGLPFERLVEVLNPERDPSYSPICQVAFVLQTGGTAREAALVPAEGASPMTPLLVGNGTAKFDLSLTIGTAQGGGLSCAFEYRPALFDRSTIARLAERFVCGLEQVLADPEQTLNELDWLTPAERERAQARGGLCVCEQSQGFLERVLAWAKTRPDACALESRSEMLTYRELACRARSLARYLKSAGVGTEGVVGCALGRSPWSVIAFLAALDVGAVYLPLDPRYPLARLQMMLEESGAALVLHEGDETVAAACRDVCAVDVRSIPLSEDEILADPLIDSRPERLAYVIFTSGSTGRPKPVALTVGGLAHLALCEARVLEPTGRERVLQFASPSFDASIFEFVWALAFGGTLCFAEEGTVLIGENLADTLRRLRITTVTLPPSTLASLGAADIPGLSTVVVAGEPCPEELAKLWSPRVAFLNCYGPTEATVWVSWERCRPDGRPTLGVATPGNHLLVLDENLEAVPDGVAGEIFIAGPQLGRGYLNQAGLSASRFVPDPSGPPGHRLYRTGDVGRFLHDGRLQFLHRADAQLKVRGYRIEPAEIVAALERIDGVSAALVQAVGNGPQRRLISYVTSSTGEELLEEELFGAISQSLPSYMVPSRIHWVLGFPQTPAGKVDFDALAQRVLEEQAPDENEAELAGLEREVARFWSEILEVPVQRRTDNFFHLGGHSLMVARVIARLQDQLGLKTPISTLFEFPELGAFTASLACAEAPGSVSRIPRLGRPTGFNEGEFGNWG